MKRQSQCWRRQRRTPAGGLATKRVGLIFRTAAGRRRRQSRSLRWLDSRCSPGREEPCAPGHRFPQIQDTTTAPPSQRHDGRAERRGKITQQLDDLLGDRTIGDARVAASGARPFRAKCQRIQADLRRRAAAQSKLREDTVAGAEQMRRTADDRRTVGIGGNLLEAGHRSLVVGIVRQTQTLEHVRRQASDQVRLVDKVAQPVEDRLCPGGSRCREARARHA